MYEDNFAPRVNFVRVTFLLVSIKIKKKKLIKKKTEKLFNKKEKKKSYWPRVRVKGISDSKKNKITNKIINWPKVRTRDLEVTVIVV